MGIISKQAYSNTVNILIGFVAGAVNTIIILPRAFESSLDDWGLLKLILSLSVTLAPVFGIGVNNIVVREYAGSNNPAYRKSILGFSLLVALAGAVLAIVFVLSGGLGLLTNARDTALIEGNLPALLILSVSLILAQVFSGYIMARHKTPAIPFINDTFLKSAYLILALFYLVRPFGFDLFLNIFVTLYVAALLIYIVYAAILGFEPSFYFRILRIRKLFTYGLYTVLDRAASIIVANLDVIMIAYLLKLSNVAVYGLAFFIASVLLIPQRALMAPAYPLISKALKENKTEEVKKLYRQSSINQIIIGGMLFALTWGSIDAIYGLIPNEFSAGKPVVFYVGMSRLFILSTGISGPIIIFSKFYRVNLIFNLFLLGLTIISNYFLIGKFGMPGAAMATAVTFLVYNTLKVGYIRKKFGIQPFTFEFFKATVVLAAAIAVSSYLQVFPELPFLSILLKSVLILFLLAAGFYGLRIRAEILELPGKLFRILRK